MSQIMATARALTRAFSRATRAAQAGQAIFAWQGLGNLGCSHFTVALTSKNNESGCSDKKNDHTKIVN